MALLINSDHEGLPSQESPISGTVHETLVSLIAGSGKTFRLP